MAILEFDFKKIDLKIEHSAQKCFIQKLLEKFKAAMNWERSFQLQLRIVRSFRYF